MGAFSYIFHLMLGVTGPHEEFCIVNIRREVIVVNDQHDEIHQGNDTEDPAECEDITNPGHRCSTQVEAVDTQSSQEEVQQDSCYEGLIAAPELCGAVIGVHGACIQQIIVRKGGEAGVNAIVEQLFDLLIIYDVLAACSCKSTNGTEANKSKEQEFLHNYMI
jgi:hypothetical protein